jgi:hypothetical protein
MRISHDCAGLLQVRGGKLRAILNGCGKLRMTITSH